jgi:hypothetical protein
MAACSSASPGSLTDPRVIAADLRGTWSDTVSYPGISTILHLTVTDTIVSGSGTYTIEAGRPGTLTVAGVISGSQVKLDLQRDYGLLAHFTGTLRAPDLLGGFVTYEAAFASDPAPMGFRRTAQ